MERTVSRCRVLAHVVVRTDEGDVDHYGGACHHAKELGHSREEEEEEKEGRGNQSWPCQEKISREIIMA